MESVERIVVSPQRPMHDYVLLVLNLLGSGVEEVELQATKENACMLADIVSGVIKESGGRVVQVGGGMEVERRRRGRRRLIVYVKLRLQM